MEEFQFGNNHAGNFLPRISTINVYFLHLLSTPRGPACLKPVA
jgi:hypothetical protein